jgi:hypothetical protein
MLIQPNKNELGDRNVKDAESVAKLKETIFRERQKDRLPNQALLENKEMAVGNAMSPADFIRRLQKFPNVVIQQGGFPNAVSVKTPALDDDPDSPTYGKTVLQGVSAGFYIDRMLPEWSSYENDKWGIPVREIRGWRTVLLTLMHKKVLTYSQVKAAFGEPSGQRNILWRELTRDKK